MAATSQQKHLFEDYDGFVGKFKPKLTTDDCYTPEKVYEAVKGWACARFGIDPDSCVRPFYPGGDYEAYGYPEGCTVLDNPPFSILSKIIRFYLDSGIAFFLFAPSLTAFSGASTVMRCNHVMADGHIVYDNGAAVRTSFVTSYGGNVAETAPDLSRAIDEAQKVECRQIPKYDYPDHVATAAMLGRLAKHGIRMEIGPRDCAPILALDSQRAAGKAIFGHGLLLSDAKAAESAAAKAAESAAIAWELSERERAMIAMLGG